MVKNKSKITDLYEDKVLTRTERNESGQWERVKKELRYRRPVNNVAIGLRFVNTLIDVTVFGMLSYIFEKIELSNVIPFWEFMLMLLFPIYYIVGEYYFQQTIGKFFTNSIVINEFGERPDLRTIVVRTVIRFMPFAALSFSSQNRALHDRRTNTYVIPKDELKTIKRLMGDPNNLRP